MSSDSQSQQSINKDTKNIDRPSEKSESGGVSALTNNSGGDNGTTKSELATTPHQDLIMLAVSELPVVEQVTAQPIITITVPLANANMANNQTNDKTHNQSTNVPVTGTRLLRQVLTPLKDEIEEVNLAGPELKRRPSSNVRVDANYENRPHWPESRKSTGKSRRPDSKNSQTFDYEKPKSNYSKITGKYEEIPNLLDGFRMLNRAPAHDPHLVYAIDVSSQELMFVVEDDLSLFRSLETLKASENALPFARLGVLPVLKKLVLSCNGVTSLDLDVDGRFQKLEVNFI